MKRVKYLPLFTRGFARGATWSLIAAIPIAIYVAKELLEHNTWVHDSLTDVAFYRTYTVRDIVWNGLGGMAAAALFVILPWATVCGFIRCFRRTVDSRSENAHAT